MTSPSLLALVTTVVALLLMQALVDGHPAAVEDDNLAEEEEPWVHNRDDTDSDTSDPDQNPGANNQASSDDDTTNGCVSSNCIIGSAVVTTMTLLIIGGIAYKAFLMDKLQKKATAKLATFASRLPGHKYTHASVSKGFNWTGLFISIVLLAILGIAAYFAYTWWYKKRTSGSAELQNESPEGEKSKSPPRGDTDDLDGPASTPIAASTQGVTEDIGETAQYSKESDNRGPDDSPASGIGTTTQSGITAQDPVAASREGSKNEVKSSTASRATPSMLGKKKPASTIDGKRTRNQHQKVRPSSEGPPTGPVNQKPTETSNTRRKPASASPKTVHQHVKPMQSSAASSTGVRGPASKMPPSSPEPKAAPSRKITPKPPVPRPAMSGVRSPTPKIPPPPPEPKADASRNTPRKTPGRSKILDKRLEKEKGN